MTIKTKEDLALLSHLFRRAGFGATYDQLENYAAGGYEAAVEELLHPETQPAVEDDLLLRLYVGWQDRLGHDQDQTYWVYKMINTRRPLEEKIGLFWHSVLCTGFAKIDHSRVMTATLDIFRRHGLGNFRDLLALVSRDPGMIYYLDNCMSHKGAINENWGRELLELFSMGVGNYSEDDVKEASKAFTGWTIAPTFPAYPWGRAANWDFLYDPTDHDQGRKAFLGQSGKFNGDDIVDLICQQPATARFIARHMYNFFVADEPGVPQWPTIPPQDPEAIDTLVTVYLDSHYDIRSMLQVLFNADFFKRARFSKIKSPTEVVIGTLRLVKAFSMPSPYLIDLVVPCRYMGQDLQNPPSVEGWHSGPDWIDSGTLVERVNFLSGQLGDTNQPGVQDMVNRLRARGNSLDAAELVDECAEQLGGVMFYDDTKRTLIEHIRRGGAIDAGSEDFALRAAEALALIVSTKEYQFN